MKLNLKCGNTIRSGYLNIDLIPNTNLSTEIYRQGSIECLDWICEDNTVEEILATDALYYILYSDLSATIQNWSQKLLNNGTLKIAVIDLYTISKMYVQNQLSINEYLSNIFGSKDIGIRMAAIEADMLISILNNCGLIVTVKKYNGAYFYVEAIKRND